MKDASAIRQDLLAKALELGFDQLRVAPVDLPAVYNERLDIFVERGYHADMNYLAGHPADAVRDRVPGAACVLVLSTSYRREGSRPPLSHEGVIGRYAMTRDYHKVIGSRLKALCAHICETWDADCRGYVDTGPFQEKAFGETAGLGYMGRNTCLINAELGSWFFVSIVLCALPLPPDPPDHSLDCGNCRLCLQICPTDALKPDGSMDAALCISYQTIENRGSIPEPLREAHGKLIFGCDLCQEICPHNRRLPTRPEAHADLRFPTRALDLAEVLAMDDAAFLSRFAGTPLMRPKRRGLQRNACVAAGNSGDPKLIPALEGLLEREDDPVLREHAEWALGRLRDQTS